MSKKLNFLLWSITGLVALLLIVFSTRLVIQSNEQAAANGKTVNAYLTSEFPKVILLVEPDPRSFVSTIETQGVSVVVTEYQRRGRDNWFHININEREAGWIQGKYISLEKP